MTTWTRGPGAIRIAAGRWKGKALEVPASARPTSARAREALFDILGPQVVGMAVLDLHAGSGAVALEALSRGAERAVLVDLDTDAIEGNVERLGAGFSAEVIASDAAAAVDLLHSRGDRFDLVFSDPPYAAQTAGPSLERILAPGGVLVIQTDADERVAAPPGLQAVRERFYGRNVFHFFMREAPSLPR